MPVTNDTDPLEFAKEDVQQEKDETFSQDEIRKNLLGDENYSLTKRLHRTKMFWLTRMQEQRVFVLNFIRHQRSRPGESL